MGDQMVSYTKKELVTGLSRNAGTPLEAEERNAKIMKLESHVQQMAEGKPKQRLEKFLEMTQASQMTIGAVESEGAAGREHATAEATQTRAHVTTESEQTRDLMTTQLAELKRCVTKITDVMTGKAPVDPNASLNEGIRQIRHQKGFQTSQGEIIREALKLKKGGTVGEAMQRRHEQAEEENRFFFNNVIVGRTAKARFKLINPNKVFF